MTTSIIPTASASPLRQRLIADVTMRPFSAETHRNYLRDVGRLASCLGRSPGTASVEDLRRFQTAQQEAGLRVPTLNAISSVPKVVLAWLRQRPCVHSTALGARSEEHLRDDLGSIELTVSEEQARASRRPAGLRRSYRSGTGR